MQLAKASTSTASVLLGATAALHGAWGLGSSWPLPDRVSLADAVMGTRDVPRPAACFVVAGMLTVATSAVSGYPRSSPVLSRVGAASTVMVLAARGVLGLLGHTHLVSPGSDSERFGSLDRRLYSPACLLLAALSVPAVTRSRCV
jgi:hypothetical protein